MRGSDMFMSYLLCPQNPTELLETLEPWRE